MKKNADKTKDVKLGQTIPVEIRYDTIVVEDGTLYIYRDVYERGTNTEENLRRVLQLYGVSLDSLSAEGPAPRGSQADGCRCYGPAGGSIHIRKCKPSGSQGDQQGQERKDHLQHQGKQGGVVSNT